VSPEPLSPAEQDAILNEWDRLQQEPQPADNRSVGCVLIIAAVALVILGPRFLPWVKAHVGGWSGRAWFAVALTILLYGLYQNFFGNRTGAQAYECSAGALKFLAERHEASSKQERLSAAVTAIYYAYYSGGPYMASSYDASEWKCKLGAALDEVKAVEAVLIENRKAYNVFTESNKKESADGIRAEK